MKRYMLVLALPAVLAIGAFRSDQVSAEPGNSWEEFQQEWLEMYDTIREMYPDQGVCLREELYRWTGPTPIELPSWTTMGPEGVDVDVPDPVFLAELMCDPRWIRMPAQEASLVLEPLAFTASGTDKPGKCTAMLVINPGSSQLNFTCSSGPCTSPTTCRASNTTSGGKDYGFCACNVVAPTTPDPKCTGTFTPEPGRWVIDCDGTCDDGDQTCKIVTLQETGGPLWYWCDCVTQ